MSRGLLISNKWIHGTGPEFVSTDPVTGEVVWRGCAARPEQIDAAVAGAREAATDWAELELSRRREVLERFARLLDEQSGRMALAISREVGKPDWEAATEVNSMIGKVALSVEAHERRCASFVGGPAVARFQPHGVVAVLGPFNFPGHLPNGHIVPALLAGNTVVFKPSEQSPLVAEETVALWERAGLPAGVLNLVQGGGEVGAHLVDHPGVDGVFFTGSARAGVAIHARLSGTPRKILALEMGGNNPLIVHRVGDREAAVLLTLQSAFLSAGQRCTCARRLIVERGEAGDGFLEDLVAGAARIRVGQHAERPEPFMGPVISMAAAAAVLKAQAGWVARGGEALLESQGLRAGSGLISPGIIDVSAIVDREDGEVFGPLLQVIRVDSFDAAIEEANRTSFGLAAGLISDDRTAYDRFRQRVRAGLINWNQQLTGASGAVPFGGIGLSGNHRPSGYFAADYCSYPVASIEIAEVLRPASLPPGLTG